jgi:hypothetical protein
MQLATTGETAFRCYQISSFLSALAEEAVMKLWRVRVFRPKHGYLFPMLPRRPGLCPYPVVQAGALFYKWPSRVFYSGYPR